MDWAGYSNAMTGIDPQRGLALQAQLAQMNGKNLQKVGPGESLYDVNAGRSVYSAPDKPHFVDAGDSVIPVNPQTGQPIGPPIKKNMSPDARATDARGRESLQQSERHFQAGLEKEKVPAGYRANGKGGLEYIPGGPSDPSAGKATDTERMASGYYDRMAAAEKVMKPIEKDSGKPGLREAAMTAFGAETAANALPQIMGGRSPERQSYRQAQEDWVRAKLRKESGAVIARDEMNDEIRTYFPQVGDSAKVVEQKANARKVAANAMRTSAGPVASPSIESLLDKYLKKNP
jgi:hypothetical protein